MRLAATVILARPQLEVYLTRRSSHSAFAPDAFVFPGGTTDPQDALPAACAQTLGLEAERIREEFRATLSPAGPGREPAVSVEAARTLLVTALRELFEEAGVLLARGVGAKPIAPSAADWELIAAERIAVRRGALPFAEFLHRRNWHADAGSLALFSHWITPPSEPRRYNTHFFFAIAPPNQAALADAHETHDGIWVAPAEALERNRAGQMHLVYPTIKHLERLAAFDSVQAALAFARRKPILTVMPFETAEGFALPTSLEGSW